MSKTIQINKEEQLREEIVKDFEYNYFVEAGAGAGKTKLIVDRITAQLSSGKYKPEEIVAITFTNKAAQELNGRIASNLRKAGAENPGNTNIKCAIRDLGRMQISTIHSFCHRLLSENCFEAGLRLDFELLEEEDALQIKKTFFTDWFNKNAGRFTDLTDKTDVKIHYSDMERTFCDICDLSEDVVFQYENYNNVGPEKIDKLKKDVSDKKLTVIKRFIECIDEELSLIMDDDNPLKGHKYSDDDIQPYIKDKYRIGSDIETIFKELQKESNPFIKKGNAEQGTSVSKKTKQTLQDISELVQDKLGLEYSEVEKATEKYDAMKEALVNTLVLDYVLPARSEYRKQRFNQYLTNDLLLQRTNKLLDTTEVAEKIRKTFKCIYVDEFQDTDPVQTELINKICIKDGEYIPGLLFVVGDVKQSIYRFREADYRLFDQTRKEFEAHPETCKVASLNINNRSNSEMVDFFNKKVKSLPDNLIQYDEDMIPRKEYRTNDVIHGVYKCRFSKEEESLIKLIKHLVEKATITEDNGEGIKKRPIEYKDILVLTSNAKGNGEYVSAFRKAGIPARVSIEYKPSEMYPLRRYVMIYRYLAMPYYKRAKEGILGIAQGNTSSGNRDNEDKLELLRDEVYGMSGAEMAGWLLEHGELYLYNHEMVGECQIRQYQMAIRQMVDQILSKCDNNALAISDALDKYVDESNTCDREIGYDKNENAIRIMNIHKAKGLEGNIVIIAQRKSKDARQSTYTQNKDRYQTVKILNYKDSFGKEYSAYAINQSIKNKADEERDKEEARLEYVAVTRAKEALVFMEPAPKNDSDKEQNKLIFSNYIDDDIQEIYSVFPPDAVAESDGKAVEGKGGDLVHTDSPTDEAGQPVEYRFSPSTMEIHNEFISKEDTKTEDIGDQEPDKEMELIIGDVDSVNMEISEETVARPSGDIFGTVMHRAFELAVLDIRNNRDDWDKCINRAINENNDDIETRYKEGAKKTKVEFQSYLKEKLPVFVKAISERIVNADEVHTEFPFYLSIDSTEMSDIRSKLKITEKISKSLPKDGEDRKVWLNGKADLIIVNKDKIEIWDYKSDKKDQGITAAQFTENIHNKYDNQMNLYKWVMEKHFTGNISGHFYSVEIGEIK